MFCKTFSIVTGALMSIAFAGLTLLKYGEIVKAEKYIKVLSGVEGALGKGSSGVESP